MSTATDADASVPRELWRELRRHPRDLPERLMVFAVHHQAAPAKTWAHDKLADGVDRGEESERQRKQALAISRIDGAVSGTPFLLALLPAYVAFLWTQTRMMLRIAALYGHDPGGPHVAAEMLTLRGVYPSVPDAQKALDHIGEKRTDESRRDRLQAWYFMVRRILVLAAFTSASDPDEHPGKARQALSLVAFALIWIVTCILPVTFMVLMAWSCDTSTRHVGAMTLEYYSGEPVHDPKGLKGMRTRPDRHHGRRVLIRWTALAVSILVPLGVIAYAVSQGDGLSDGLRAIAAVVGLAVVIAIAMLFRK
jgi:hypothetical protein